MVKQNDLVRLADGSELRVTSIWAQGRHRVFCLEDDSLHLDLDKAIDEGKAQVIAEGKTQTFNRGKIVRKEVERMPRDSDDIEE